MNIAPIACQSHSEDVGGPPFVVVFVVNISVFGEA